MRCVGLAGCMSGLPGCLCEAQFSDQRVPFLTCVCARPPTQHLRAYCIRRHEYGPDLLSKITDYTWQAEVFGRSARREQVAEEVGGMSDMQLHELCEQYPQLRKHALPSDRCEKRLVLRHFHTKYDQFAKTTGSGQT